MVEHHLAKVRVAGSNPVVRSKNVQVTRGPRGPSVAPSASCYSGCYSFPPWVTCESPVGGRHIGSGVGDTSRRHFPDATPGTWATLAPVPARGLELRSARPTGGAALQGGEYITSATVVDRPGRFSPDARRRHLMRTGLGGRPCSWSWGWTFINPRSVGSPDGARLAATPLRRATSTFARTITSGARPPTWMGSAPRWHRRGPRTSEEGGDRAVAVEARILELPSDLSTRTSTPRAAALAALPAKADTRPRRLGVGTATTDLPPPTQVAASSRRAAPTPGVHLRGPR